MDERPTASPPASPPPAPPRSPLPAPLRARMESMRVWGQLASVGLSFALAIVIGALLGAWLDRVTGWTPVCFLVFFFCGMAAGALNVYRALKSVK